MDGDHGNSAIRRSQNMMTSPDTLENPSVFLEESEERFTRQSRQLRQDRGAGETGIVSVVPIPSGNVSVQRFPDRAPMPVLDQRWPQVVFCRFRRRQRLGAKRSIVLSSHRRRVLRRSWFPCACSIPPALDYSCIDFRESLMENAILSFDKYEYLLKNTLRCAASSSPFSAWLISRMRKCRCTSGF